MASYRFKRHYWEFGLLLLGLVMGCWLRKLVFSVSNDQCKGQTKLPSRLLVDDSASSRKNIPLSNDLLMIGVMTNRQNLATRAASIFATWGQSVPGKIVFYIGESDDSLISDSENKRDDAWTSSAKELNVVIQETAERKWRDRKYGHKLPVVQLPGIRDSVYPPRSKSFAMLRHMHFHYGARYKWFMRADDDVFVRTDLLETFLLALDNKRLLYMGQPGIGKASERGKLGLKKGAPYCMGGPGVFLSSYTLRRLVPYLSDCEQQVVTSHEDSELGRCVQRFLNLPCTRNLQMQMLFYQNYVGMNSSFAGPLRPPVFSALTLHPVKDVQQMFRLQLIFDMLKLEKLQLKQQRLLTAMTAFSLCQTMLVKKRYLQSMTCRQRDDLAKGN
ncbi:chondroitin sulfate synthase 1-like [Pomacea canaliculata]|uniref:chondroitin sulfate synthase 1-like n=1 Tax=Pomacea canaliculata TaxID=400727 RepID=UPI000D72CD8C|nr:chondroitin sulfate synthase 1-like [Pomacea canaliculata]